MKYQNPIIRGFHPDPSICRVGEDFYLVTSSFEYFPGIPIYHSRDLVNWEQIGNCIERKGLLPFEKALAGGGMWAPTIRWNDGKFYVTASFMDYGNFIISSENPAEGWSDPVKAGLDGLDPSLLFDGGRAYYCTNYRTDKRIESISLAEIDVETGALLSDIREIWRGFGDDRPKYLESPHIYHIGDWYYLLASEGGTRQNHMITGARSRSIWGPYEALENNPILTNRYSADEVSCSGHGDLTDDIHGNWWAVHLAMRPRKGWYSHMGRETFLLPLVWKEGLPYIADGRSHIDCEAPLTAEQEKPKAFIADFGSRQPQWLFLREPREDNYVFDGRLTLKASQTQISDREGSPTFLAVRQMDLACTVETELEFEPRGDGDEAGITVYLSDTAHYCFCKKRENGSDCLLIYKSGGSIINRIYGALKAKLKLKLTASEDGYLLYYGCDGEDYVRAGRVEAPGREEAGKCYTGMLIGLYAQCDAVPGARAVFPKFCMEV